MSSENLERRKGEDKNENDVDYHYHHNVNNDYITPKEKVASPKKKNYQYGWFILPQRQFCYRLSL